MENYLDELNEEQREAVVYDGGPSLVVAGAGSGKTRVLTCKIAFLLEQGYAPWNILALTFTNKAAKEMKERIALQVGGARASRVWMGTFHSVFLRILHSESDKIGFTSHFTIYDESDSKNLIHDIIRELNLDAKEVYKPNVVQARISQAKNKLIGPDAYAADSTLREEDNRTRRPALHEVYKRYAMRCRMADAMDFDDLLYYTYLLFRDHPDVLSRYRALFRYVLVDEYQDTNYAQHAIVCQLAGEHEQVFVVGDDAQSIYSFRGAEIGNMLHFTHDFPHTRIFKLQRNYRSTQSIVKAANSLIRKNRNQIRKEVYSQGEEGEPVSVYTTFNDNEEARLVAKLIEVGHRLRAEYDDFAILYRTHAQSRTFEEEFRRQNIPYRIFGGLSFYQRKEIKDVIAYFRLAVNTSDEEALKRIINYPTRGIGNTTVDKLKAAASAHNTSLWAVLSHPESADLTLSRSTLNKIDAFRRLIESMASEVSRQDAYTLASAIVRQSGIAQELQADKTPEGESHRQNVEELLNAISAFCDEHEEEENAHISLADFLSEVSLLTDQDMNDDKADVRRVSLMTIHSAKGLEFNTVFVVGLEEGLFPSARADGRPREMEEERRLFYVALTRARRQCYLTSAHMRYHYGKMTYSGPSRFLSDIDPQLLQTQSGRGWTDGGRRKGEERKEESTEGNKPTCWLTRPTEEEIRARYQSSKYQQKTITVEEFRAKYILSKPRPTKPTVEAPKAPSPKPRLRQIKPADEELKAQSQLSTPMGMLTVGGLIDHERFGIGEVLSLSGEGADARAVIRFRSGGEKTLILRYAKYKIVNSE